jgi:hypothetical protein
MEHISAPKTEKVTLLVEGLDMRQCVIGVGSIAVSIQCLNMATGQAK